MYQNTINNDSYTVNPDNKCRKIVDIVTEADYMTASRLQSERAFECEDSHVRLSHYTLYSEGKVRRWTAERRSGGGGDLILENDRSSPPLSLPRCIDLHRGDRQKCLNDVTALAFKRVET